MNTVKTVGDFIELVRTMRIYQKIYYEEGKPVVRHLTKKYQDLVDEAIKDRDERESVKKQQPDLQENTGGAA